MYFIDVLTVKKDVPTEQAYAYFAKATPILARHGFVRSASYRVMQKMRGHDEVNPTIVLVWQTRGPESFQSLRDDPDYHAIVPERDSIFEMGKLQGWFAEQLDN